MMRFVCDTCWIESIGFLKADSLQSCNVLARVRGAEGGGSKIRRRAGRTPFCPLSGAQVHNITSKWLLRLWANCIYGVGSAKITPMWLLGYGQIACRVLAEFYRRS